MASEETTELVHAQHEATRAGNRLFRNNRGMFLTLDGKRKVRAGLEADGASDLIGFTVVEITPNMIGQKLAVFTAVEMKKPNFKGPRTETERKQACFLDYIRSRGGIAFFCDNGKKLQELIKKAVDTLAIKG